MFQCIDRDAELRKQLVHHVPKGYIYVEPFANGMSLFWYLSSPFPVEVINDLYGDMVGIYRVLQDVDNYEIIIDKLAKTPFSEEEFNKAVIIIKDPNFDVVNKTWAFFVIHSEYLIKIKKHNSGFEKFLSNMSNDLPLRLKIFVYWFDRLSRVQIDCIDAIKCIKYWDTPDTVFYVNPPHDLHTEFYKNLVDTLLSIKGKVLLLSYEHPAFENLLEADWQKLHNEVLNCNSVLYMNFKNDNLSENSEKQKVKEELFDI